MLDIPEHRPAARTVPPALLALAALALGVVWDFLFNEHIPGVSVPLFWGLILGALTLFDRMTHRHMKWREAVLCLGIFVLSLFSAIRASDFLGSLNAVAMYYLFLLLLASLYGAKVGKYHLSDLLLFPLLDVFDGVMKDLGIFRHIVPSHLPSHRVVRGLAAAALFAAAFIVLFATADLVVSNVLSRAFDVSLSGFFDDFVISILVGATFLLIFAPAFWKRLPPREIAHKEPEKDLGIESMVVFIVSNAVFAAFLVIQFVYLFGSNTQDLSRFGLTYAQYAREGFFQLLVVAVIVGAMAWAMRFVKQGEYRIGNSILQAILILQTFAVLASSWMRLSLYEDAFGFTELRLFSHYFLVVVVFVLILLLAGLITKIPHNAMLHGFIAVFAVGLLGLNFLNPDLWIANKNIERAGQGKDLDAAYLLQELSDDAAPAIAGWLKEAGTQQKYQKQAQSESRLKEIGGAIMVLQHQQREGRGIIAVEDYTDLNNQIYALQDEERALWTQQTNADFGPDDISFWLDREPVTDWQSWNAARLRADVLRAEIRPLYAE